MPQGFQVFNADGSLQFDTSNRLFRVLSVVSTGTSDGSATVAGVNQGTVAAAVIGQTGGDGVQPVVTGTGSGVAWTFNGAPTGDRRPVDLAIMVY